MARCGTRDAGAGATERLTADTREGKRLDEKVVLVSFFLGVGIEIYCT
jgi:hypothetical protein